MLFLPRVVRPDRFFRRSKCVEDRDERPALQMRRHMEFGKLAGASVLATFVTLNLFGDYSLRIRIPDIVIASEARQSRAVYAHSGVFRFARNDGAYGCNRDNRQLVSGFVACRFLRRRVLLFYTKPRRGRRGPDRKSTRLHSSP